MVVVGSGLARAGAIGWVPVASEGNRQGRGANLKLLSRALFALALTALAAVIVRLRGSGGTPPHRGGWRELTAADLERADKR
jgi:hypothetical protein